MFTYTCRLKLLTTSSEVVQNYEGGMYLFLLAPEFPTCGSGIFDPVNNPKLVILCMFWCLIYMFNCTLVCRNILVENYDWKRWISVLD